jgi:hypothetical protein
MDAVLSGLRWRRSRAFDERYSRLRPKGAAPGIDELRASELYLSASADVTTACA